LKALIGTDIGTYTFNASSKQITFSGFPNNYLLGIQQILLITDITNNIIIYNFASPLLGGVINNNILTLTYNTGALSNNDILQIYIDTEIINESLNTLLRRMNKLLESNAVVDINGRQRVSIDSIGTAGTLGAAVPVSMAGGMGAASAVTIAAGQGPLGTANANYQGAVLPYTITSQNVQYIGEGPVDQRFRVMDDAHVAYATAIRTQLSWA
jgi:hypothetical protein